MSLFHRPDFSVEPYEPNLGPTKEEIEGGAEPDDAYRDPEAEAARLAYLAACDAYYQEPEPDEPEPEIG
jgi:hypothetical protein